jgi:hypothetical protein
VSTYGWVLPELGVLLQLGELDRWNVEVMTFTFTAASVRQACAAGMRAEDTSPLGLLQSNSLQRVDLTVSRVLLSKRFATRPGELVLLETDLLEDFFK